ncbi:MAG TPA: amidohydrolase [Methylomusa anaerophila]|uniref:N-acyl-L-amino acid amidohydrolase n=1 Tax=Methylomusa anaerophila TaxID=1930071 RepID=A0A348AGZ9_9FIRM|nr:amidohydrolase [Methylomusa anaerophila]BBB90347.1 N-acyl-L-amino acid amidohydrolase [Methylomusa anaerophila]HML89307.1 amidohydrolase [Methylomusa anaerophila]
MLDLLQQINNQFEYMVAMRRYFHINPELSGQEEKTQAKIMDELRKLELEPRKCGGTGIVAELTGGRPGKTVALRADMDALPLHDELDKPYCSQVPGVCHACGHDGHMATLLGVAKVLSDRKGELSGNVRFLFQPSEEHLPGGALNMINAGGLSGVDAILGIHLWQPLPLGVMGITYGPIMASANEFCITVLGKGGHASMPQQTVDAILVGAQIVNALNTIVSRNINPQEAAVVSVGVFQAGKVYNIIADNAVIKGTVRVFDLELRETIFCRIEEMVKGICAAYGANHKLEFYRGYPPVINHPEIAAIAAAAGQEALGEENVWMIKPVMAGEDFSYYLETVPGAFWLVGAGNAAKGIVSPHHHPQFDFDETAMIHGAEILLRTTLKILADLTG